MLDFAESGPIDCQTRYPLGDAPTKNPADLSSGPRVKMRNLILVFLLLSSPLGRAADSFSPSPAVSLDGDWQFVADPRAVLTPATLGAAPNIRPARVPGSWQAQFFDLRGYTGVAWYWREVTLEAIPADHVALLRFGAVDYRAEVFVNGERAGSHEGGYLPFAFDVTSLVKTGENRIAVRVVDVGGEVKETEGIRYAEIPHGKQDWYVETSGLWQSVRLEVRPRAHLRNAHITAGADGAFQISLRLSEATAPDGLEVTAAIFDPQGKQLWGESRRLPAGETRAEFAGQVTEPALWNLENPVLHTLRVKLSNGDTLTERFGFRTFTTREGKFYLNGWPLYLRGALDQDFYPDTIYTPPSYEYLLKQVRQAKRLGLNLLRCHIKVPDPRYLDAADEAGILIWYEIPNWDKLTEDSKRRAWETFEGMVERDWNHPSIVAVSLVNESWGADLSEASHRQWLLESYQRARKIVPGWLVVDNSACCQNFHLATDVADFHQYNAIPDYASDFDRLAGDMARRPRWLFSPYGDAVPRGDEPIVLSEFGNWGLPAIPETKPWWWSRDFQGIEITRPEGIESRFAEYGLESVFPNLAALTEATQRHQYRALKFQIEALRARNGIQGYVITEFTDLNWEANGLLDMWRQPKPYAEELAKLQQDDLLLARAEQRNFLADEKVTAEIVFSRYSGRLLENAVVYWELEGTELKGSLPLASPAAGTVTRVGSVEFLAPEVSQPSRRLLKVSLVANGRVNQANSIEFFFYPRRTPTLPPAVSFHDPAGRLRRLVQDMRARNYLPPSGRELLPVLVTSTFDETVRQTLQEGGRVLLLAADKLEIAPGLEVLPRANSRLDGNWISSFLWVRRDRMPFTQLGFETLAGFEVQSVAPPAVLRGVPPDHFDDVLAGMFYGWVHSNVAVLAQVRCGKGRLLISTFSLGTTYTTDPYATHLLDALVEHAVSGPEPRWELPGCAP